MKTTDYAAKREALLARAADLDGRLADLETQRKGLALSAVDGDKDSIRKIDQIDAAADALRRERDTAAAAAEAVEQLERDHQAAAAQKDRERRERQARHVADAVLIVCTEIDGAMTKLREMFEKRSALLRDLADTRIVASNYLLRLHQKFGGTAAARKAGLDRFIAVEHIPIANVSSLADSSHGLRGPLTAAVESEEAA